MIATTIEQSKKLLESGLALDTSDMYYEKIKSEDDEWHKLGYGTHPAIRMELFSFRNGLVIPAWSFAALWDIMSKSGIKYDYSTIQESEKVIDSLVEAVARFASQGRIK